jgi:hypothetical protein
MYAFVPFLELVLGGGGAVFEWPNRFFIVHALAKVVI